jgi:putative restriction endonuclease
MLLAAIDLARSGQLIENRLSYGPELIARYRAYFEPVRAPDEVLHPYYPYFHLQGPLSDGSPSFWHLVPLPGREAALLAIDTPRRQSDITNNVAYVSLDPELHRMLQNDAVIDQLTNAIGEKWFQSGLQDLFAVVERASKVSKYERLLRTGEPLRPANGAVPTYVRDPAFRRVVTQIYDYRCAATGVRILLPTGEAMVEAAHIHPFSEARDDDPRNGIALSPDMHWAMDRNLVAPGPDLRWHVSKLLDKRIPDFQKLCELDGRALLLPAEPRMYPKRESLAWRIERLREPFLTSWGTGYR